MWIYSTKNDSMGSHHEPKKILLLPVSHSSPVYPVKHVQLKKLKKSKWSLQVALLWHGEGSQTSASKNVCKNCVNDILCRCISATYTPGDISGDLTHACMSYCSNEHANKNKNRESHGPKIRDCFTEIANWPFIRVLLQHEKVATSVASINRR